MNQQLLEFGSFLARAQQNKNEVERRITELRTKRHGDAASELRDIQLDMVRLKRKISYSLQAMAEIGAAARRITSLQDTIKTELSVVRKTNGEFKEEVVDEHTVLQSGDVMRVNLVAFGSHVKKDPTPLN
jgi:polysaccharide export outer membrane protein